MRVLLLCLLFLVNHAVAEYSWPAKIEIDTDSSIFDRYEVISSVRSLNKFVGFEAVKFNNLTNRFPYSIIVKFAKLDQGNRAGLAAMYRDMCYITIYPVALENNLIKIVMWHEIAHCAGLLHVESKNQIMSTGVLHFSKYGEQELMFFRNQLTSVLRWKMY